MYCIYHSSGELQYLLDVQKRKMYGHKFPVFKTGMRDGKHSILAFVAEGQNTRADKPCLNILVRPQLEYSSGYHITIS